MGIDWLIKWKESVSEMMSEDISLGGVIEKFRADIREVLGSNKGKKLLCQWVMEHHIPMCAMGYLNYFKKKTL